MLPGINTDLKTKTLACFQMSCLSYLCRYSANYPSQALELRLQNALGLSGKQVKDLANNLKALASTAAKGACVVVFDLVDQCQEYLRQHNNEPEPDQEKEPSVSSI